MSFILSGQMKNNNSLPEPVWASSLNLSAFSQDFRFSKWKEYNKIAEIKASKNGVLISKIGI